MNCRHSLLGRQLCLLINTVSRYWEMELCISPSCVFAPWLNWGSFISVRMVSRQTSHSAFVCALPSCHLGGSKEKVALKATPLPSLQPRRSVLKWGQMTHEPRVHLSLSCFLSLLFYSSVVHTHIDGGVLWREKTTTLWQEPSRCDAERVEKYFWLLSKKARLFFVCWVTVKSNGGKNLSNRSWHISLCCVPFWILIK